MPGGGKPAAKVARVDHAPIGGRPEVATDGALSLVAPAPVAPAIAEHRPIEACEESLVEGAGAFVATPMGLSNWAAHAGAARVAIYARVERLPRGGVGERARQLHAAGIVAMLPQRRVPGTVLFDYRVRRSATKFDMRAVLPDVERLPADERLLLDLVAAAADAGEPCPTNRSLAALLGLKRPEQVTRLMGQLRLKRLIAVEDVSTPRGTVRQVTIHETGAVTFTGFESAGK